MSVCFNCAPDKSCMCQRIYDSQQPPKNLILSRQQCFLKLGSKHLFQVGQGTFEDSVHMLTVFPLCPWCNQNVQLKKTIAHHQQASHRES